MDTPKLTPRLIVESSAEAIDFYRDVFGAEELERYATPDGKVVHAAISVDGAVIALADETPEWHNEAPARLGGSPVILTLMCDDPDAIAELAVTRGARVVFPIDDQFYGHREGRIVDPFGHVWILSKIVRKMSPQEIQRAVAGSPGE